MSMIKEQAVRMIDALPDDNVNFLVELMQRFMMPKEAADTQGEAMADHAGFMRELEAMRMKAKSCFPPDLEYEKIRKEAIDERYDCFG